jgi:hypothetical protein
MHFLSQIQRYLEETYGLHTGLDVTAFIRWTEGFDRLGEMVIEEEKGNLNLAIIFDRDILAAWDRGRETLKPREVSVPFEEVSHFVYLAFNHERGRNVTPLELELQSEVDRIMLAFHGETLKVSHENRKSLLAELFEKKYVSSQYEESRLMAVKLLKHLAGGDPSAWSKAEFETLRKFFHSDLSEKLHLVRKLS